jgi:uroporphyrinogen decarboxylase
MNSKEQFLAAINHKEADRVPVDLGGWVSTISIKTYNRLRELLGMEGEGVVFDWLRQTAVPEEDVLQRLGVDTRYVRLGQSHAWQFKPKETEGGLYVKDEWGCGFLMPASSYYFNLVDSPLKNATVNDLEAYPWPNPDDTGYLDGIEERAKELHEEGEYAVIGDFAWESWFERAWKLRAMDHFFMDMAINKEFVHALLDKTVSLHEELLGNVLDECGQYLDVIIQGGDLGTQNNTLISLEMYREFVKPRQERIIRFIKERTNAKVYWHSCGAVDSLINDFIEAGIDILNPVQVSAKGMDPAGLKKQYGDRIVFWGGIDSQNVLPYGSPEDVRNAVKNLIKSAAPGGGLVVSAVHNIQADVPEENVLALFDAVKEFGRYSPR